MSARQTVIVHQGLVSSTEQAGYVNFGQPENIVDFSLAERVTFSLTVLGTVGTADSWNLRAKFQRGQWNTANEGFTAPVWADITPAQVATMVTEGRSWNDGSSGVVATNATALPFVMSRTLRDFGALGRVYIRPVAVNPSADFAVRYTLMATYRIAQS